jgi:hypothetical protein
MTTTITTTVAGLQRSPLLSIPDMQTELDAVRSVDGVYAWWLINPDALREVPAVPHPTESAGLLYVGVGPSRASSLTRKLRERFGDHTRGGTGRSTLRLALAAFLFEREGWRPYWTDRPVLTEAHNEALSEWQAANLRMQWCEVARPWEMEAAVIRAMRPPLNRKHNRSHPFYPVCGAARRRFREAARASSAAPSADGNESVSPQ